MTNKYTIPHIPNYAANDLSSIVSSTLPPVAGAFTQLSVNLAMHEARRTDDVLHSILDGSHINASTYAATLAAMGVIDPKHRVRTVSPLLQEVLQRPAGGIPIPYNLIHLIEYCEEDGVLDGTLSTWVVLDEDSEKVHVELERVDGEYIMRINTHHDPKETPAPLPLCIHLLPDNHTYSHRQVARVYPNWMVHYVEVPLPEVLYAIAYNALCELYTKHIVGDIPKTLDAVVYQSPLIHKLRDMMEAYSDHDPDLSIRRMEMDVHVRSRVITLDYHWNRYTDEITFGQFPNNKAYHRQPVFLHELSAWLATDPEIVIRPHVKVSE